MDAPSWPHSALLQVLSTMVFFVVMCRPQLQVTEIRTLTLYVSPYSIGGWVPTTSGEKSVMPLHCYGTARRLPPPPPPPPWDTARCLWVLGYGHPERTIALYASSATPQGGLCPPSGPFLSGLTSCGVSAPTQVQ